MTIKERNRKIKEVLAKEFGWRNVKVKGGRGTSYGWVDIYITAKKPHKGECKNKGLGGICEQCRRKIEEVKSKAWEILEREKLTDELFTWHDDMNNKRYECTITIKLDEHVKEPQKRDVTEIEKENYKIVYEGNWTWIYFKEKPNEEIRSKLKDMGFKFSKRRIAWYLSQKVDSHALESI